MSMESLREAWEANAPGWIEWSRSPELDHAFWRMNLPALIGLLPAPGTTVLDVGCGEGRVARALKKRGYAVIGVEGSETLATAAQNADPEFDVHVADVAAMPFADGTFELAIASLMLMNVDDLSATVAEIARVLVPGGHLCVSLLHPVNTWNKIGEGDYFATHRYSETLRDRGRSVVVNDTHRPLQDYFEALTRAGFSVERMVEPRPDAEYLEKFPAVEPWRERPAFLHLRALLLS
jgi:ubiquinone/menaquinone biosynthesis C-methylase UbiE